MGKSENPMVYHKIYGKLPKIKGIPVPKSYGKCMQVAGQIAAQMALAGHDCHDLSGCRLQRSRSVKCFTSAAASCVQGNRKPIS